MTSVLAPRVARSVLIIAVLFTVVAVTVRVVQPKPAGAPSAETAASTGLDVATLEAAVKAAPGEATNWLALGSAFFAANRFGDAVKAYRKAVQLTPDDGQTWSSLGEAAAATAPGTMPAEARAAFEKAIALDPADPRARYFLAMAKDLDGDHRGAIDDWIALLRVTPPGAGWEATVRTTVEAVAARNKINIAARLKQLGTMSPTNTKVESAQAQAISAMVGRLATRLKTQPGDVGGWTMLIRSYAVLGRARDATAALASAKAANPTAVAQLDATATSLGVAQ